VLAAQTVDKGKSTVTFLQRKRKTKRKNEDNVEYIQWQKQAVVEMLRRQREKQQKMNLVIMEQLVPEDHFLRKVDRHVWQDALDDVIAFTKSGIGSRNYAWRKETIERSFAEAKVKHGLRYARMFGIKNMREQCFLTTAVQNIKRPVDSLLLALTYNKPCILH